MDKGSKHSIYTMKMVVKCMIKKFDLEDDKVHAIYSGWK